MVIKIGVFFQRKSFLSSEEASQKTGLKKVGIHKRKTKINNNECHHSLTRYLNLSLIRAFPEKEPYKCKYPPSRPAIQTDEIYFMSNKNLQAVV